MVVVVVVAVVGVVNVARFSIFRGVGVVLEVDVVVAVFVAGGGLLVARAAAELVVPGSNLLLDDERRRLSHVDVAGRRSRVALVAGMAVTIALTVAVVVVFVLAEIRRVVEFVVAAAFLVITLRPMLPTEIFVIRRRRVQRRPGVQRSRDAFATRMVRRRRRRCDEARVRQLLL